MLDVAVLVPLQPMPGSWVDATIRSTFAPTRLVTTRAKDRLFEMLGVAPGVTGDFGHRSLTSVVLATSLERAGLHWRVLDPGAVTLGAWRKKLEELRTAKPRVIAISSTFIIDGYWLGTLCELVRRTCPGTRIAVGGYAYATDAKHFLSLDADVLCVGEGEKRIAEIVQAFRDGSDLSRIPGLYVRGVGGELHYTGDPEPLALDAIPLPDWSLAPRIEPSMTPEREPNEYCVETQRGCIFKCEFCTYRTIAAPMQGSIERAVRALRDHEGRRGEIFLIDATATTPRDRWMRILARLIEEGGLPLPTSAYARVSDLDDEMCAMMAKAGVVNMRIGQESGDQNVLNAMKKGTRVDQIAPAIAAMARHGMIAQFLMIFGFPGETEESMATTRRMLRSLNEPHQDRPVVRTAGLSVFDIQNFAAVGQRDAMRDRKRFAYADLQVSPARAAEAVLDTWLELSKVAHAPATGFRLASELYPLWDQRKAWRDTVPFFRWTKAIDRAMGIYVEAELGEKKPNQTELRRARDEILAGMGPEYRPMRNARKVLYTAKNRLIWKVVGSWAKGEVGVSALTRAALGMEVGLATGRARDVIEAVRTGRFPILGTRSGVDMDESGHAANKLVRLGMATGRRRLQRAS